ncbi:polysaccharide biosynthesis tyrosine autokinase [Nocardioides sp.]|uniref:tyrosine-protein kinase domain-containing protein n=1 Tax=Nocardioides sp. TaxID=35761 RepID=UPI003527DCA3
MDSDVTNLADHAAILRRRWRILTAALVIGVAVGALVSLNQPTRYTAVSRLLLEPTHDTTGSQIMSPDEVATQADVVASSAVARQVVKSLALDTKVKELLKTVTVQEIDQTRVVEIEAVRPTAQEAADVANAFAESYIQLGDESASQAAVNTTKAYSDELARVEEALRTARAELANPKADTDSAALRAQVRSLLTRQGELNTSLAVAGTTAAPSPGLVLREADVPAQASQPRLYRNLVLGAFLGLLLGLVAAYARDRVDDRIRDESRLRRTVGSVPIVGRIPVDTRSNRTRPAALAATRSPVSEAFRTLNTNIRFLVDAKPTTVPHRKAKGTVLLVTSSEPEEAKTTVSCNLAVAAARVGLKVLLIDADLRHPRVSEKFGLETPRGLAHVLAGQSTIDQVIIETGVDNLQLMGGGVIPPNPAELLASSRAHDLWRTIRSRADLIIIDAAPVLRVADPLEIAPYADDVLLATRHRVSRVHQVEATLERLTQVGADVAGVVWSGIPGKTESYSYGAPAADPDDDSEAGVSEADAPGDDDGPQSSDAIRSVS